MEAVHKFIVADESEISADDLIASEASYEVTMSRVRFELDEGVPLAVFTHLIAETTRKTLSAGNKVRGVPEAVLPVVHP